MGYRGSAREIDAGHDETDGDNDAAQGGRLDLACQAAAQRSSCQKILRDVVS